MFAFDIELSEYNMTITHENFFDLIQKQVELDYDKEENKPKKIGKGHGPCHRQCGQADQQANHDFLQHGYSP